MIRLVWFHPRWPFPPRGGGDLRTTGLISGAVAAGHRVLLVVPEDRSTSGAAVPDGIEVVALRKRRGAANLTTKVWSTFPLRSPRVTRGSQSDAGRAIAEFGPELAVVSEVMSWSLARNLIPAGVQWVYDAHNVEHELFNLHLANANGWLERCTMAIDKRRVARAEQELIDDAAAVMAVSTVDELGILQVSPRALTWVVPSSVIPPDGPADPRETKPVAMFVGSLDFPPNVAAIEAAVHDVFPRIHRACPDARLLVVGRRPSERLRRLLGSRSWIEFEEDAPSLEDAYARVRLVLMPFGAGSGTKLKLYEAMAFGVPVVTTEEGVAGVALHDDDSGVEVCAPARLAEAAIALLQDPWEAGLRGAAARRYFLKHFTWERASYPALERVLLASNSA